MISSPGFTRTVRWFQSKVSQFRSVRGVDGVKWMKCFWTSSRRPLGYAYVCIAAAHTSKKQLFFLWGSVHPRTFRLHYLVSGAPLGSCGWARTAVLRRPNKLVHFRRRESISKPALSLRRPPPHVSGSCAFFLPPSTKGLLLTCGRVACLIITALFVSLPHSYRYRHP